MKKIISLLTAAYLGISVIVSCTAATADSSEPEYFYTAQDVQNLQDFLLTRPVEDDLVEKLYDLNADGVWDAFDLALMKRNVSNQKEETEMKLMIEVNGHTLIADFADNSSAQALAELIKNEPLTLNLNEYGSFEKVGALPQNLPRDDEHITTEPGDIMLYQGNQMTIFYGTNTWSYTRLGRIDNVTQAELKEILGDGNVTVTLFLAN